MKINYTIFIVFLYFYGKCKARTDAETKLQFTKIVMSCLSTNPVPMPEILALQKFVVPKNKDTKCLLACAYKKEGSMTSDGKFDLKHGYELAIESKEGDEKRLENARKLAEICEKVNEEKVSDDDKGCERAALIFKCTVENAPKLGFKI